MPGPRAAENKENAPHAHHGGGPRGSGPHRSVAAAMEGSYRPPAQPRPSFEPRHEPWANQQPPLAAPQFGRKHHALAAHNPTGANAATHELLPGPAKRFPPPSAARPRDQA